MFLFLQQNRKLELITIDEVPKPANIDNKTFIRVIVILSRSHPGESVTSFVCQGLLEFLLGNHPIAKTLRDNFVFKIIPMLNPDGVFLGNNRCNLIGQDLNRSWNVATEFSHPTIAATKQMLKELDTSDVREYFFNDVQMPLLFMFKWLFSVLSSRFCIGSSCAYKSKWLIYLWQYIRRCLSL